VGFGGLLFAASLVLEEHGTTDPGRLLFGVDVDPEVFNPLSPLRSHRFRQKNFVNADFFAIRNRRFPSRFRAIVANPPFLRHHQFGEPTRAAARNAALESGVALPKTSALWAYFVVHATTFLAEGARMGLVLPRTFLHADYAKHVRQFLVDRFGQVSVVSFPSRLFAETPEQVVFVLASEHGQKSSGLHYHETDCLSRLDLQSTGAASPRIEAIEVPSRLSLCERNILAKVRQHSQATTLGDAARLSIGTVTGANSFFVRSRGDVLRLTPNEIHSRPIVSRSTDLLGIDWTERDHQRLAATDRPSFLLLVREPPPHPSSLASEIKAGADVGLALRYHCRRRRLWYQLDEPPEPPDAFLPYSSNQVPRLISNSAGSLSTNSIHQVRWLARDRNASGALVGSLTSLWSVMIESTAASRGRGALKLELRIAQKLLIPDVPVQVEVVRECDKLLREGRHTDARELADRIVLKQIFGLRAAEIEVLRNAANRLREFRLSNKAT
jgi:hypothetical protein